MGWASSYIEKLQAGETVSFRPRGNSMLPYISSGWLCTVEPLGEEPLKKGNIVLCRVKGKEYLHLIKAVGQDDQFRIGNAHGKTNGWTHRSNIFGRLIRVEP